MQPVSSRFSPPIVLSVIALGMFMSLLDLTIVNIAIPSLVDGLHASLDQVLWVLNAYSLVYAVLLITSGRLGDIVGPRTLVVAGLAIFTAASAGSGLAHDPLQLIVARAAQGLGAALMSPQGMPIMISLLPPERRGGVFAVFGILGGLAVLAGPTLGGFIVSHLGWRWIFYVNLPIGIVAMLLTLMVVPDIRPGQRHRLDFSGVVLATAGLLCLVFGLIEGQRYSWGAVAGPLTIPVILVGGVLLIAAFLIHQARRQRSEPLLPFAVFRDRNFTLMALVLAALGFAMLGLYLPLTIYYQSVLGMTAVGAGITIAAQPLAMMVSSGVASGLIAKVGGKVLLIPGLVFFALGMGYIDWVAHVHSGRWSFLPGLIVAGLGLGCVWTPVFSIATADLQPRLAGVGSGVLSTIQELGGVGASAAVGALLQNRLASALSFHAERAAGTVPATARGPFVHSLRDAGTAGLEVGRGGTGGALHLPAGLPAGVAEQIIATAHAVFIRSFVDAMRPTLVLPIALVLLAALAAWGAKGRSAETRKAEETPRAENATVERALS